MNLQEIEKQLNELSEEVRKYKNNQQQPKYKRWRNIGGYYWFVDIEGFIFRLMDKGSTVANYRYATGNYHQTEEQAIKYRDTQILRQELKDFAEGYEFEYGIKNWYITLDENDEYISIFTQINKSDNQYFATKESGDEAIAHFGDRLDLIYKTKEGE